MTDTIRVDLHCHSRCSDGLLSPRELAFALADDGVLVAALTDHDTTAGQEEFANALAECGLLSVPGAELTVDYRGEEAHLLAYGFALDGRGESPAPCGAAAADAIAAVHRAGGLAVLAHPHMVAGSLEEFREVFTELQAAGLDGVEAYYANYTPVQQRLLADLAAELGLLASAGSDAHDHYEAGGPPLGVAMPSAAWRRLDQALGDGATR